MEKLSKASEIELVCRYLGNPRLLKSALKMMPLADIQQAHSLLETLYIELEEEEKKALAEAEALEAQRKEMLKLLEEKGWTLEQLLTPATATATAHKPKKARVVKADKYAYPSRDGGTRYWSGYGRVPAELKALLDEGRTLEEFLVDKSV